MVQKSLKLFLLGLLLWPVLINLVGFISLFWVPLVSIIFAMSLIFLSTVDIRLWIKISCWIASIIYVGCSTYVSTYVFFPEEEKILFVLIDINYYIEILMLFLGGIILLRVFNDLTGIDGKVDSSV